MKERLGFCMCGSFCTHSRAVAVMKSLSPEYDIIPILSEKVISTDTRFGTAAALSEKIAEITPHAIVSSIVEAERFGPSSPLDAMLICPCTGNTLAKIALGITDGAVTMAAKAHLRSDRPLLICLATNDALSGNIKNIGTLMQRKNVYFVPMVQDDVTSKPHSLVADFSRAGTSLEAMKKGTQLRPIFLE